MKTYEEMIGEVAQTSVEESMRVALNEMPSFSGSAEIDWNDIDSMIGDDDDEKESGFWKSVKKTFSSIGSLSGGVAAAVVAYMAIPALLPLAVVASVTILWAKKLDKNDTGLVSTLFTPVKNAIVGVQFKGLTRGLSDKKTFADLARRYNEFVRNLSPNQRAYVSYKIQKLQDAIKNKRAAEVGSLMKDLDAFMDNYLRDAR